MIYDPGTTRSIPMPILYPHPLGETFEERTTTPPPSQAPRKKKVRSKKCEAERRGIEQREDSNKENIEVVLDAIISRFGQSLSHPELLVVTEFICERHRLKVDRAAVRNKRGLIVWCAENITEFLSELNKMTGEKIIDGKLVCYPSYAKPFGTRR